MNIDQKERRKEGKDADVVGFLEKGAFIPKLCFRPGSA
jgi:hypothetical protein